MYCPRCSQQQVSEETKFCSRCGFPLGLVSEILSHGGFLPQLAELYKDKKLLTRRNGLIFSLFWFLIITMMITPLAGISGAPEGFVAFFALIGSVGAIILVIASMLLRKESKQFDLPGKELPVGNIHNIHGTQPNALPLQQSQPANSYVPPVGTWKAPDTGEFARPSSVTEGTTKLLEKNE